MNQPQQALPVIIVGAGPIGLTTALGLSFHDIPFALFEEDDELSSDTKAGTLLTRTIEVFRRYGVSDAVLSAALRIDEIGSIDRVTGKSKHPIYTHLLRDDTRFPFVINLPQHHLEPILAEHLTQRHPGSLHRSHRMIDFTQHDDHVVVRFDTPQGLREVKGSYLLGCDGGRSTVRQQLGIEVEGKTLDVRYMLVDLKVDLDVQNARDYPYLAYFAHPDEWMILVRQPHCWRFLFPLEAGAPEASDDELRAKALRFIGAAADVQLLGKVIYRVHHRVARDWRVGRAFLMGDAAHLITPMWALGLNTGVLDSVALPWRLAWVMRGWASAALLDGYQREQLPIAVNGSAQLAEAARLAMSKQRDSDGMSDSDWGNAATRMLLGVNLDVSGAGGGSMVKTDAAPAPLRVGDRMPDWELHGAAGHALRLHDLSDDRFVALYFTDVRHRPAVPHNSSPALHHFVVSRWDAPHDSGLRDRALLDIGNRLLQRVGCGEDVVLLVRPDDHIAAIVPLAGADVADIYRRIVGLPAAD